MKNWVAFLLIAIGTGCGQTSWAVHKPKKAENTCESESSWQEAGQWFKCSNGRMVEDVEAENKEEAIVNRRWFLIRAAGSRLLTPAEMEEFTDEGWIIFVRNGETFDREVVQKRYDQLMLLQAKFPRN